MALVLRALLSAALIGLCFASLDAGEVARSLSRIPVGALALCLAFMIGHTLLCAWRWRLVCRALGVGAPSLRDGLRWTALGVALSQALPSTVGGDAYRIGTHARQHGWAAAARGVIHDRLSGLWVLAAVATACGATALWLARHDAQLALLGAALGFAILAIAATAPLRLMQKEARAFRALLRDPQLLGVCLAIHGMTVGAFAALSAGVQPASDLWWQAALVAPGVMLVAAVPISVGGWGVREAASLFGLGLFSVAASQALALSVAFGLMQIATGMLGAIVWASLPPVAPARP